MKCVADLQKIFFDYKEKRDKFSKEELSKELVELKKKNVDNLENLLDLAIKNLKANGCEVFLAKDKKEAQTILKDLTKNIDKVAKSKSNVAKEIELTKILEENNIKVAETDLGDWLSQICKMNEIHPVLPAVELKPDFIVEKIQEKFGEKVEAKAQAIAQFAKKDIAKKIDEAKVGITGANAVSAEGEIIILENEGNISRVSRLPEHHIVVTGIEKIVANIVEAMHVVKCSAVWGTGQKWPAYVNVISGPSKTADIENELVIGAQGAQKVSVVLVDNGRKKMLKKYKDLLRCINCGACLNFCPAYYQLLEKFGYKYLGAKGILWTAFTENFETAKDNGLYQCSTCEACWHNCPADINLPEYIRELRKDIIELGYEIDGNKEMMEHVRDTGNPFGELEEGEIPDKLYCC